MQAKKINRTDNIIESLLLAETAVRKKISRTAWHIAYTALWNGEQFSRNEIIKAKVAITGFLNSRTSIELAFEEFTERVLLTRRYLLNNPGKYVPHPSEWLSETNAQGFAGTEKWYNKLQNKRAASPLYKTEWQNFGWAVFQAGGKNATKYFHEWRSYYAEKNQALLNLYLATVANSNYWFTDEITVYLHKQ